MDNAKIFLEDILSLYDTLEECYDLLQSSYESNSGLSDYNIGYSRGNVEGKKYILKLIIKDLKNCIDKHND